MTTGLSAPELDVELSTQRTPDRSSVVLVPPPKRQTKLFRRLRPRRDHCVLPTDVCALIASNLGEDGLETLDAPGGMWTLRGYFSPWSENPALAALALGKLTVSLGQANALLVQQEGTPHRRLILDAFRAYARTLSRWIRVLARELTALRLTSHQWDDAARPIYNHLRKLYSEVVSVLRPSWAPSKAHE